VEVGGSFKEEGVRFKEEIEVKENPECSSKKPKACVQVLAGYYLSVTALKSLLSLVSLNNRV